MEDFENTQPSETEQDQDEAKEESEEQVIVSQDEPVFDQERDKGGFTVLVQISKKDNQYGLIKYK